MREIIGFNQGWRYKEEFKDEFVAADFADQDFTSVTLPHTNKVLPYNYFDEKDYQFISCYRKTFAVPQSWQGKRVFIDFDGVMAYAEVYINGELVTSHKGGYTHFTGDLTEHLVLGKDNTLVVKVDSTERPDIPPFGNVIDYLCYGGIYRDVELRVVDPVHISNVFAKPQNVLEETKSLATTVFMTNASDEGQDVTVEAWLLREGDVLGSTQEQLALKPGAATLELKIEDLTDILLWDVDNPNLYNLEVVVSKGEDEIDVYKTRIGFREAVVKPDGFYLNGKKIMLRGLNRHQSFPYVGYAMPARVQRKDADILKDELHLNAVRTSHYPQSRHFLDRCDEIGLMVFEEIPGWQHIGATEWKEVSYNDVRAMITRDWNHPSIFLWGVRINESGDDHEFYKETNRIARELDPTRQTGGVRYIEQSEFLEDVYTMNDFIHSGGEKVLRDPKAVTGLVDYVPYMVTEFNGHMYPTKRFDQEERLVEHALRHLRVYNAAAADPHISGSFGWCAFDYNTHFEFGSGDRICYHGVMDMFRLPKFAANFYRSQVDPEIEAVLEPATLWTRGERSASGILPLVIFTNCDEVEIIMDGHLIGKFTPEKEDYPGVDYAPVIIKEIPSTGEWGMSWSDVQFTGIVAGKAVVKKTFAGAPVPTELRIKADDEKLIADGSDATRVVFELVDQEGNLLPFGNDVIEFKVEGPGELIGPETTGLIGGCIAAWIKTTDQPGEIKVQAISSRFASETITILSE